MEAQFTSTSAEFERRLLVEAGQCSMHQGLDRLFNCYNGKRMQAGKYVASIQERGTCPASMARQTQR